jgi:hypothetical protein
MQLRCEGKLKEDKKKETQITDAIHIHFFIFLGYSGALWGDGDGVQGLGGTLVRLIRLIRVSATPSVERLCGRPFGQTPEHLRF